MYDKKIDLIAMIRWKIKLNKGIRDFFWEIFKLKRNKETRTRCLLFFPVCR